MNVTRRQAIVVFLAFAFAYFFSALLRAVTATLAPVFTASKWILLGAAFALVPILLIASLVRRARHI